MRRINRNIPLYSVFQNTFGKNGARIYEQFTTTSHIKINHGGAPRSNYIAEYFIRCALENPRSTRNKDYRQLREKFIEANKQENAHATIPNEDHLNAIMQKYLIRLKQSKGSSSHNDPKPNAA